MYSCIIHWDNVERKKEVCAWEQSPEHPQLLCSSPAGWRSTCRVTPVLLPGHDLLRLNVLLGRDWFVFMYCGMYYWQFWRNVNGGYFFEFKLSWIWKEMSSFQIFSDLKRDEAASWFCHRTFVWSSVPQFPHKMRIIFHFPCRAVKPTVERMVCCLMCPQKQVHRSVVLGLHSDIPGCTFPRNLKKKEKLNLKNHWSSRKTDCCCSWPHCELSLQELNIDPYQGLHNYSVFVYIM